MHIYHFAIIATVDKNETLEPMKNKVPAVFHRLANARTFASKKW